MSEPTDQTPPRLEAIIRAGLALALREEGFRGSGRKFHREVGPWLHVITVQGSRWGGSFAVNLGIHFTAAVDVVGNPCDPSKMTEAHCEFRRRLSEGELDHWWKHANDAPSMHAAIRSAGEMYLHHGRNYFASAVEALATITPHALAAGNYDLHGFGSTKPRLGLALARIRKLEGMQEQCRGFAEYALHNLGSAKALRPELEALAAT
jgi:Domain of unknown function (DUF4304)